MLSSRKGRRIVCENDASAQKQKRKAESLGSEIAWSAAAACLEQTGTLVLQPERNMRGSEAVQKSCI